MNFFDAILVVIIPFIVIVLPAVFFIRIHAWNNILLSGARIILWSMGTLTLLLTLGLFFGISVQHVALLLAILGVVYAVVYRERFFTRQTAYCLLAILIPILLTTAAFTIPFLLIHDGLPTGDIQKTIIWAQESLNTNMLPKYDRAISFLNRDPVDFYTPGLHAVSALVLSLSPAPLLSMGIFSILLAVCVAWIAASITKELFDEHVHVVPPILAAVFLLTQFRFLRYLREPGYHFQNVVGELFLFGMVMLCIRFLRRREAQDAALFIVCGAALFLTHQFSMFIAAFVFVCMALACCIVFRKKIMYVIHEHRNLAATFFVAIFAAVVLLFSLGLGSKVTSLFTTTPHLIDQLLPLSKYPNTMGEFWLFSGIAGLILLTLEARKKNVHYTQVMIFLGATAALLILSQGPRFGIDIPPVRALFYLAVPLSITSAYLFGKLLYVIEYAYKGKNTRIAQATCMVAICIAVWASTSKSYASLNHAVRTNSTLTAEQLGLIELLQEKEKGGILIDDYSRKSASWLVLANIPMFTRIGADLERQMTESSQSPLRNNLYLRQLDYEKIVELGSLPEISSLFAKNNIKYVTGIAGASYGAFAHNAALQEVATANDTTLFEIDDAQKSCMSEECNFLFRPSTLANDIGDELDAYEYLQASIRSPRLSEPKIQGTMTYRDVSSPIIPLSFNVGDYVRVLWDPENAGNLETPLTFMLWLTKPMQGLSLRTPSGTFIDLPYQKHITVELPRDLVQINDKGFISFSLYNEEEKNIPIDLIALGI
ncbi:MAG: hypothetical protein O3A36_03120 [bacterium]|nr:hypothetical protein [bacterium]